MWVDRAPLLWVLVGRIRHRSRLSRTALVDGTKDGLVVAVVVICIKDECSSLLHCRSPCSVGTLTLSTVLYFPQAAKVSRSSITDTVVAVGDNGAHVSFSDWDGPPDVGNNSTVVVAVASVSTVASEGMFVVVVETEGGRSRKNTPRTLRRAQTWHGVTWLKISLKRRCAANFGVVRSMRQTKKRGLKYRSRKEQPHRRCRPGAEV